MTREISFLRYPPDSFAVKKRRKNLSLLSRISRFLLLSALFAAFAVDLSAAKPHQPVPARHPNVLFIAIDDLRPELACYGVDAIHSPNIDALAASGVQFDRAYCQLAVCNPSRVSVLTGLRPDSSKVWTLDVRFRDTVPGVVTLPQHFKANGYTAISFGKIFHNPWPDNRSWSEPHSWPKKSKLWSDDAKKRHADYREQMRADGKSEKAIERMRAPATGIVDVPDHEHIDGAIAQQAIRALRRFAGKGAEGASARLPAEASAKEGPATHPFFLAAGFIRPHLPFVVPRKYWDLYQREAIPLAANTDFPKNYPSNVPAMNTMYELRDYMDYAGTPAAGEGLLTIAQQRELKHGYYASVSLIDAQVGLLLGELDKLGLADNTIVVLWSDHGWKLGEHGSWCKQTNYEIDARVPLIIRAPGGKANGRTTEALVELLDLYPTLCDLAGIEPPDHIEGRSLVPLLENPDRDWPHAAFSQFYRRLDGEHFMGYAMRTDRYRYVDWKNRATNKTVAQELYDHRSDSGENTNLATSPAREKLLAKLRKQLWSTLPQPPPLPKPAPAAKKRPALHLTNHLTEPLTVTWLRPEGGTKPSGNIAPGATHHINTTLGHRFVIEGTKTDYERTITVTRQKESVILHPSSFIPPAAKRPNVLFLMADDWSWPHASALGDPVVKTPTFDRVAREGVLFENAFVSAPSCTPSRHAVSSGQYHWRPGVGADLGSSMAKGVPVYPDLLAATGYSTGFTRKGTGPSKHTYRKSDPFGPRFDNFEAFYDQRDPKKPFCFWYGAGEPHRPYRLGEGREQGIDLASIRIPPGLPDNETVRSDLADYYSRVQLFDRFAAGILGRLEKDGELDNTIVVMTGDNGMPFPRAKSTLYDTGTRVPLAIRWGARVKGGRSISDFVSLTDLAPTFLEAAGVPLPQTMTGRSLLTHLTGDEAGWIDPSRDHVLTGLERHVYPWPARAIRTKDFLFIRNFERAAWPTGEVKGQQPHFDFVKTPWPTVPGAFSFNVDPSPSKQWMLEHRDSKEAIRLHALAFGRRPAEELYDLQKDPGQLDNVATNPAYAETKEKLRRRLMRGLRATRDPRADPPSHTKHDIRGWTLHINRTLQQEKPDVVSRALEILNLQLDRVIEAVPPRALARIRKVPLWVNPPYPDTRPTAEYHPQIEWLREHGRDPAMAKAMEFSNASILPFENRRMPYVVLHELSHAYHDQVLSFDHPKIIAAYKRAKASGTYSEVKRPGYEDQEAYAMTNHKEYFAETTEAFFGKNDFYPFTREDLKKHDPKMHDLLKKLWNNPATPRKKNR